MDAGVIATFVLYLQLLDRIAQVPRDRVDYAISFLLTHAAQERPQ